MEYKAFEQFNSFGKAAMDSAKELETINVRLAEKLTRKNMELFNSAMDVNNRFVATFGKPTDIKAMFDEQMKLASEYNGKVIATMKETMELLAESKDDYQAWFEAGIQTATDAAQEIAPALTPKKAA